MVEYVFYCFSDIVGIMEITQTGNFHWGTGYIKLLYR